MLYYCLLSCLSSTCFVSMEEIITKRKNWLYLVFYCIKLVTQYARTKNTHLMGIIKKNYEWIKYWIQTRLFGIIIAANETDCQNITRFKRILDNHNLQKRKITTEIEWKGYESFMNQHPETRLFSDTLKDIHNV